MSNSDDPLYIRVEAELKSESWPILWISAHVDIASGNGEAEAAIEPRMRSKLFRKRDDWSLPSLPLSIGVRP